MTDASPRASNTSPRASDTSPRASDAASRGTAPAPAPGGDSPAAAPGDEQDRPSGVHRPSAVPPAEDQLPSRRQTFTILIGLMAGVMLAALNQSMVNTALPQMTSELGGLESFSWVIASYLLTSTAVTPLWGKLSDLYGRRPVFQSAIGIFLLGSVLCGATQSIGQLIGFRAVQGLGGGGLFAIAFAIVGDVVPPRERGRFQGYFGAVFGVSSVTGPLIGGTLTDGPGWRWVFYVNVPVGLAALIITTLALRKPATRRSHKIDFLGAATIVGAVTCLLLYLDWRGKEYGWSEPGALALLAGFVVLNVAFVLVERRAAEPVIPLRLFRNPVFSLGNTYGFVVGAVMFGTIVFLPMYLQTVQGASPTQSGLAMLPAVAGISGVSVVTGQLITRTGRCKIYLVLGAAVLLAGLLALSRLGPDTPFWQVGLAELVYGIGLGLTLQTVTTAIQNAVEPKDIGAATGGTVFFRQLGGSIGTASLGAVLSLRLTSHLTEQFGDTPGGLPIGAGGGAGGISTERLRQLPEAVRDKVLAAFSAAVSDVFLVAAPLAVLALVAALLLREKPLRGAATDQAATDVATGEQAEQAGQAADEAAETAWEKAAARGRPAEQLRQPVRKVEPVEPERVAARHPARPVSALVRRLACLTWTFGESAPGDALVAVEEAVTRNRTLAEADPTYLPHLAKALNNLGICYSDAQHPAEALAATAEAVTHYRTLAEGDPTYLPRLAKALNNLGICYSVAEHPVDALAATAEAVIRYRALVVTSAGYRPYLATALTNLGLRNQEVGRHETAAALTAEADALYREFAGTGSADRTGLAGGAAGDRPEVNARP